MPDRCTDPTCEQHWPPVDDPAHITCEHPSHQRWPAPKPYLMAALDAVRPDFESALAAARDRALESPSSIYDDLMRAKAAVDAAPAYKHDCQTQGCAK
jgi:hypothetical protein